MKPMLPDVIGHENQSQHYPDHGYLCLQLSGQITTRTDFHTTPAKSAAAWGSNSKICAIIERRLLGRAAEPDYQS